MFLIPLRFTEPYRIRLQLNNILLWIKQYDKYEAKDEKEFLVKKSGHTDEKKLSLIFMASGQSRQKITIITKDVISFSLKKSSNLSFYL